MFDQYGFDNLGFDAISKVFETIEILINNGVISSSVELRDSNLHFINILLNIQMNKMFDSNLIDLNQNINVGRFIETNPDTLKKLTQNIGYTYYDAFSEMLFYHKLITPSLGILSGEFESGSIHTVTQFPQSLIGTSGVYSLTTSLPSAIIGTSHTINDLLTTYPDILYSKNWWVGLYEHLVYAMDYNISSSKNDLIQTTPDIDYYKITQRNIIYKLYNILYTYSSSLGVTHLNTDIDYNVDDSSNLIRLSNLIDYKYVISMIYVKIYCDILFNRKIPEGLEKKFAIIDAGIDYTSSLSLNVDMNLVYMISHGIVVGNDVITVSNYLTEASLDNDRILKTLYQNMDNGIIDSNFNLTVIMDELYTGANNISPVLYIPVTNPLYSYIKTPEKISEHVTQVGDNYIYNYIIEESITVTDGSESRVVDPEIPDDPYNPIDPEDPVDVIEIDVSFDFEDDPITISEEYDINQIFNEIIGISERYSIKYIPKAIPVFDVDGNVTIFDRNCEDNLEKTILHVVRIKTSSDDPTLSLGNLPDYMHVIDGDISTFKLESLPNGEYVIFALKYGYSIGWQHIVVNGNPLNVNITLLKLDKINVIEKIYNKHGHSLKIYQYKNEIVGEDRIIEGIVIFGDLYGQSESIWNISENGYLKISDNDISGTLSIVNMRDIGYDGLFEKTTESLTLKSNNREIDWVSHGSIGDFSGFCFRYITKKSTCGELELNMQKPIVVITPNEVDFELNNKLNELYNSYEENEYEEWRHIFDLNIQDSVKISDGEQFINKIDPISGKKSELVILSDNVVYNDTLKELPKISIYGVVLDEENRRVGNACIVIIDQNTGNIVDWVVADDVGIWIANGLDVNKGYIFHIIDQADAHYSMITAITTSGKDMVDVNLIKYSESDIFRNSEYEDLYEVINSFDKLISISGETSKLYGVISDINQNGINYAILDIYEGNLTYREIVNGLYKKRYSVMTNTSIYGDGYYETSLPNGIYTIIAKASGYKPSELIYVNLNAGYVLNVSLMKVSLSGFVYDGNDYVSGILTPLFGAIVTVNDTNISITDEFGQYFIAVDDVTSLSEKSIKCEYSNYIDVVKKLPKNITSVINGYNIPMWRSIGYSPFDN